ncbi:hypothetical protein EDC51_10966 [Bibersteinia trehalosi]|uniref:hypothetical protein n=1 Tax=Bibersteinia trehalosi TaxID=47735 RepID=UPI00104B7685|nr:hypothetical protein [Bibersteinia trehalosi]TCT14178.1 hypothetical protein EDC51_10966 [Bibersteinia trehalosi]
MNFILGVLFSLFFVYQAFSMLADILSITRLKLLMGLAIIGLNLPFFFTELFANYEFFFLTQKTWAYELSLVDFGPYQKNGLFSVLLAILAFLFLTPLAIIADIPFFIGSLAYEFIYSPIGIL